MRAYVKNPEAIQGFIAKTIYKKQIRRYLGLGFFLSFIPGTEAFRARENLFETIMHLEANNLKGGELLPRLMNSPLHIFFRTFAAIAYFNIESSFSQILFRKNDIGGLNRLNPFLFLTKLFFMVLKHSNPLIDFLFFNSRMPFILKIPIFTLGAMVVAVLALVAVLYFITELILNSLNTLLVEPIRFVFEVLHQFVKSWITSMPSADYPKVNRIVEAVDGKLINEAKLSNSLQVYQTKELTLVESTDEIIGSFEKHRNSFFYEINKDRDLFKDISSLETISIAYNQSENLRKFSYFTHKEMLNQFPKELNKKIIETCLKLNDDQRMNYLMKLMNIKSSEESQPSENSAFFMTP
jgi:hypothetical protein